jgi:broad specificity phosphatase PhoE
VTNPEPAAPPRSAIDRAFLSHDPDAGELILVRHGHQDNPVPGTKDITGWLDPPLSKTGLRQAEAVGRALAGRPITAVYASPLRRAATTGRAIAEHHGLEPVIDERLREIEMFRDLPEDNRSPADVWGLERLRQAQEDFVTTRSWSSYPGSESGAELAARVSEAVEAAVRAHPGQVIAVACHGGVINAYIGQILSIDEDMFFRPAHASIHRVAFLGDRRVVVALNDMAHLDPPEEILTW